MHSPRHSIAWPPRDQVAPRVCSGSARFALRHCCCTIVTVSQCVTHQWTCSAMNASMDVREMPCPIRSYEIQLHVEGQKLLVYRPRPTSLSSSSSAENICCWKSQATSLVETSHRQKLRVRGADLVLGLARDTTQPQYSVTLLIAGPLEIFEVSPLWEVEYQQRGTQCLERNDHRAFFLSVLTKTTKGRSIAVCR